MIDNISSVRCADCKTKMNLTQSPKGNIYQCPVCGKNLPLIKAPNKEKQEKQSA